MNIIGTMKADARSEVGTPTNKRLRKEGKIPAIIDRVKNDNIKITMDYVSFIQLFEKARQCQAFEIDIDGNKVPVLVRTYDIEPITKKVIHVDFYEVTDKRQLVSKFPIKLKGTSPGVLLGGIQEQILPELAVKCTAESLKEYIELDISELNINDAQYVKDLNMGDDIKIMNSPNQCIVRISPSRKSKMDDAADDSSPADAPKG